jgi:hypothetical protein
MGLAGGESALLWDWDWKKIAEGHGVGFPLTDEIVRELSKTSQSVWNFSDVRVLEHRRITGVEPRN